MKVLILPDTKAVCHKVADLISERIKEKPDLVLGLSPSLCLMPCYQELVERYRKGQISFRKARFFSNDEFLGFGFDHPLSNAYLLWSTFFSSLDVTTENVFLLNGTAKDPVAECAEYERKIKGAGGIDLQTILLGLRGEVGRNEPTSSLGSRCRVKTLSPDEASHNGRFASRECPKYSLTLGVATMMEAKEVLLVAIGSARAMAASRVIEGPITSSVTGSIFQRHPKCTTLLDEAAATFLKRKEYYQSTSL